MNTSELIDFIKKSRDAGQSFDSIHEQLAKAGWAPADIENGMRAVQKGTLVVPTPSVEQAPSTVTSTVESKSHAKVIVAIAILFLAIGGGIGIAYTQKVGPFAAVPYTEKNLVSGLLDSSQKINTSSYLFSTQFFISPREADAKPFTTNEANDPVLLRQYKNDFTRGQDVRGILTALRTLSLDGNSYSVSLDKLKSAVSSGNLDYYYGGVFSTVDPATGQRYGYSVTKGGSDFALTISFETDNAIQVIKKSFDYSPEYTQINGRTATFTKGSSEYVYLPSEPAKPALLELSESAQYLPPEINIRGAIGASADWGSKSQAEWTLNLDGTGELGDLTYAVNIDALKKDAVYYFKINKIPSLFLTSLALAKGQWVKVDPTSLAQNQYPGYREFYSLASDLPEAEQEYRESREQALRVIRTVARIADEENLFTFKKEPSWKTIGDRKAYRYELQVRKEALIPFYRKLYAEISRELRPGFPATLAEEQIPIDYLSSPEFSEMFDYLQKNTKTTAWVDSNGFPVALEYSMRLVPADSAIQLKDKQANLVFKLELSEINKPIKIEAPANAKPVEKLIEEIEQSSAPSAPIF